MNEPKSLLSHLGEALDHYRAERRTVASAQTPSEPPRRLRHLLPTPGNVIFTLVMIAVLLWAQSAGAVPFRAESAASTGTIAYQGRLADSSGNPLTSTLNMSFRLYGAATGGTPLWTEQWTGSNGVKVSDGLFNVMLGSLTPIAQSVITGNSNLFLGITVGTDDEMTPRVQLGSVPFAVQALTVPDGSITAAKLAADVSLVLPDGSVTTAKIADGAVTRGKQAPRIQIMPMQFGSDNEGGAGIFRHLGYMVRFSVGHTYWGRAVVKLPPDWVPGTDLRIAVGAQSANQIVIAPRVCWATLNTTGGGWDVCAEMSPNVNITTGITDITLKVITANAVSPGDIIAIAFQFPGNTQVIDVTGVYLEYVAQP